MSKLLEMLATNKLTLIVELPENSIEMAKIAEEAGADALFIKSSDNQEEILSAVKIPVGLDLSLEDKLDDRQIIKNGKFDFINFHHEVIPSIKKSVKTGRIISLNEEYTLDKIVGLEDTGAQAIDAAIVPLSQGPHELMVGDLQNYIAIAISSGLPVIIPTQRSIKPSEAAIIYDTGVKGLILTPAVTGNNVKSLEETVKEYRLAVDDIE